MTFLGGRRQFASRTDFDWSYNDLCRQFKMFTEVDEFVEAVNITFNRFVIFGKTSSLFLGNIFKAFMRNTII